MVVRRSAPSLLVHVLHSHTCGWVFAFDPSLRGIEVPRPATSDDLNLSALHQPQKGLALQQLSDTSHADAAADSGSRIADKTSRGAAVEQIGSENGKTRTQLQQQQKEETTAALSVEQSRKAEDIQGADLFEALADFAETPKAHKVTKTVSLNVIQPPPKPKKDPNDLRDLLHELASFANADDENREDVDKNQKVNGAATEGTTSAAPNVAKQAAGNKITPKKASPSVKTAGAAAGASSSSAASSSVVADKTSLLQTTTRTTNAVRDQDHPLDPPQTTVSTDGTPPFDQRGLMETEGEKIPPGPPKKLGPGGDITVDSVATEGIVFGAPGNTRGIDSKLPTFGSEPEYDAKLEKPKPKPPPKKPEENTGPNVEVRGDKSRTVIVADPDGKPDGMRQKAVRQRSGTVEIAEHEQEKRDARLHETRKITPDTVKFDPLAKAGGKEAAKEDDGTSSGLGTNVSVNLVHVRQQAVDRERSTDSTKVAPAAAPAKEMGGRTTTSATSELQVEQTSSSKSNQQKEKDAQRRQEVEKKRQEDVLANSVVYLDSSEELRGPQSEDVLSLLAMQASAEDPSLRAIEQAEEVEESEHPLIFLQETSSSLQKFNFAEELEKLVATAPAHLRTNSSAAANTLTLTYGPDLSARRAGERPDELHEDAELHFCHCPATNVAYPLIADSTSTQHSAETCKGGELRTARNQHTTATSGSTSTQLLHQIPAVRVDCGMLKVPQDAARAASSVKNREHFSPGAFPKNQVQERQKLEMRTTTTCESTHAEASRQGICRLPGLKFSAAAECHQCDAVECCRPEKVALDCREQSLRDTRIRVPTPGQDAKTHFDPSRFGEIASAAVNATNLAHCVRQCRMQPRCHAVSFHGPSESTLTATSNNNCELVLEQRFVGKRARTKKANAAKNLLPSVEKTRLYHAMKQTMKENGWHDDDTYDGQDFDLHADRTPHLSIALSLGPDERAVMQHEAGWSSVTFCPSCNDRIFGDKICGVKDENAGLYFSSSSGAVSEQSSGERVPKTVATPPSDSEPLSPKKNIQQKSNLLIRAIGFASMEESQRVIRTSQESSQLLVCACPDGAEIPVYSAFSSVSARDSIPLCSGGRLIEKARGAAAAISTPGGRINTSAPKSRLQLQMQRAVCGRSADQRMQDSVPVGSERPGPAVEEYWSL
ncbi:unnamed protein product [Amoebophrya sp. A120]|nr:unnamed protein product [Amoebophrya sp. A120]|eukprot:GSA120T00005395001.1